ncbi:MAG TPA: ABC transporter substrate-binding protein [Thermomicrobiales bacterium]|nr:ABC transporter substrate-binding protein [Thermomicrobiales bacterium]
MIHDPINQDRRAVELERLVRLATGSRLTRRDLARRAAAIGLTAPAISAIAGVAGATAAPAGRRSSRIVGAQENGSTLTIALDGSPADLDPHSANDYRSALANRGPFENLIGLKDETVDQLEPVLAESWEANADKSVFTFRLREGVTFQDGSPFDAEAVRANFERLITLGLGPSFELGRFIQTSDQVKVVDARTVQFDLGKSQIFFEAALTSNYGAQIVNANAARAQEADGDWGHYWAQTNAVGMGTGPYKIVEFEPEQQLVMEKYDGYWRGWEGSHFDRIVIRVVPESETRRQLIEQGEVDIIDNMIPEALEAFEQNSDLQVQRNYSTEVDYFVLTVAGALVSPQARQAMCWAFPYDEVVAGVYKGYGKRAVGPVAELCYGHNPDTFTYTTDLAKAKELFAQAGVAEGTTITLVQEQGDQNVKSVVQLFQANLGQIGINLDVQTVTHTAFVEYVYRDATPDEQPNVLPWFWWPIYNDAWDHLQLQVLCAAAGSAGANAGYYCNAHVDELLNQVRDTADPQQYLSALAEVQQILTRDDPPAIYFLQRQWTNVLRKDIAGFVFNPINIGTYDFYRLNRAAM